MFEWLNGEGAALKHHIPGRTNYLTDLKNRSRTSSSGEDGDSSAGGNVEGKGGNRPFPLNPYFVSEPILSEELRNAIYEKVVVQKQDVRTVSAQMHVDMRRVAAVVRLVELEKRWRAQVCLHRVGVFLLLLLNDEQSISLEDASHHHSQLEHGLPNYNSLTLVLFSHAFRPEPFDL